MGFLGNPIKAIGKGLSRLPGAKTLNKPINKALGQTPGLKSLPGKLGMAGPSKTRAPIAPSPGVVDAGVSKAAAPAPMSAPPQMEMQPQMSPQPMQPQMQPQMGYEAPEEVMGMEEKAMQAPMQPQPQPQPQPEPQPMEQQQLAPAMEMLKQRMGGNTGVTGGMNRGGQLGRYNKGIGPRFM